MSTTKVITSKVRFSYANVFEPRAAEEGQKPKYSVSLIIPKKDKALKAKIDAAIKVATEEGKTKKFAGKIPANLKMPLRDGDVDRADDPNYKDSWFINASSANQPGLIDADRNEILDRKEFKSGDYGKASINFYAFNTSGNKGIAAGLNNLMKLEDGEPLGGAFTSAEDDFADDEDLMG